MTDLQKQQIIVMRKQNATYTAISDALGIPTGTIKTFCRRNGITVAVSKMPVCKNCGAELPNLSGARQRLFCSDNCKQTWWNNHRTERISTKLVSHICPICGKPFTAYAVANRKYCSQACYRKRVVQHGN